MNALLNHVWGKSPAADRVWAQVTGLAPGTAVRRLLMVFQAFMDESEGPESGVLVLGGYVATAEIWARFSAEWERMLPAGTLAKNGKMHFKMFDMAASPERMERVPGFFRIIEDHAMFALSCSINVNDIKRAQERLWVPDCDVDWGFIDNPYIFAFRALMDNFHAQRSHVDFLVPAGEKIDFIFDKRSEKRAIYDAWEAYIESRPPETRALYGASPRFEDDQEFLPLQAADFNAWWVREWTEKGIDPEDWRFGAWRGYRYLPDLHMALTEAQVFSAIVGLMRDYLGPQQAVYDLRYPRDKTYSQAGMRAVRFRGPSPFQ